MTFGVINISYKICKFCDFKPYLLKILKFASKHAHNSSFTIYQYNQNYQIYKIYLCQETNTNNLENFLWCHLTLGKVLTRTDCDIIFAKSKQKKKKTITYAEFKIALGHVAARMSIPVEEVEAKILSSKGPVFSGTTVLHFFFKI